MTNRLQFSVGAPVTVRTVVTLDPVLVGVGGTGLTKASLWTGEGPPHLVMGAAVGDEYLDTTTGTIYRLDPGA